MLSRHTRKRTNSGIDLRAGSLPLALPPPGDPRRAGQLHASQLTWTLRMDHEWLVRCAPLRGRQPTFGFLLREADRWARHGWMGWVVGWLRMQVGWPQAVPSCCHRPRCPLTPHIITPCCRCHRRR